MIISEEIKRLHELHQAGALTDAEFAQAKAKLLNSVNLNKSDSEPPREPLAGSLPESSNDLVQEFRRLRRSRTDRWIGGVCGGLGHISGMESWIWRLVFVMFTLTFGFGLAIYILLWIFVPDEESRIL